MKRIKIIFIILLTFSATFVFQSCQEETVPISSHNAFTIPVLVAPANGAFISPAGNTVDLKWSSTDADGDPQKWDIYFGTLEEPGRVKVGNTSQTYTVNVAVGTRYYWHVTGYDANGIPTRSDTWSFEIVDPNAPLKVRMEWSTDILDKIGLDVPPLEAANLRLKILNEDHSVNTIVNTNKFEDYTFLTTLPDGKYYVAADLASTVNAGDFNEPIDISINLMFNKKGTLSESISFPSVMTNENPCDLYSVNMAMVSKAGVTFTVEKDLIFVTPPVLVWKGTDATYPSEVTTTANCTDLTMSMLVKGWMNDWWGEIIIKGGTLVYTVDGSGNVTIPFQYYCTTTYNGAVQPDYSIQGSGTLDNSGAYPVMTLHYDINQGGTWIGHYSFLNYGWTQDGFDAVITTDPNGKGGKGLTSIRPPKPNR